MTTYSIASYDGKTVTITKGFETEKAALDWAELNCEPDPRWFLLSTPEGDGIVAVQNAPKNTEV